MTTPETPTPIITTVYIETDIDAEVNIQDLHAAGWHHETECPHETQDLEKSLISQLDTIDGSSGKDIRLARNLLIRFACMISPNIQTAYWRVIKRVGTDTEADEE